MSLSYSRTCDVTDVTPQPIFSLLQEFYQDSNEQKSMNEIVKQWTPCN